MSIIGDIFAWLFLGSYASTALENERVQRREAYTRNKVRIAPYTRDGQPVYLVGYIFEHEDCQFDWQ